MDVVDNAEDSKSDRMGFGPALRAGLRTGSDLFDEENDKERRSGGIEDAVD